MSAVRRTSALAALLALGAAPAHAELYYLIVAGLGGQPTYQEQFDKQAAELETVAKRTTAASRVTVLKGDKATRAGLEQAFGALKRKTKATDSVAVVLIGHGSFDGEAYKFNLPGPDIDGTELGKLLTDLPAKQQLLVDATSASGAIAEPLAVGGRTVITATRSGFERNATRFAQHWAKALASGAADIDKDGVITAQEAFDYASREVADSFKSEGTLATEHAQLKGDGAARFTVARLKAEEVPATPELAALDKQRKDLDGQIAALRARRTEMDSDTYLNTLQDLLVKLATVQKQIDDAKAQ
jgi:hypothetical protein